MTAEAASRRARPLLARLQPGIVELLWPLGGTRNNARPAGPKNAGAGAGARPAASKPATVSKSVAATTVATTAAATMARTATATKPIAKPVATTPKPTQPASTGAPGVSSLQRSSVTTPNRMVAASATASRPAPQSPNRVAVTNRPVGPGGIAVTGLTRTGMAPSQRPFNGFVGTPVSAPVARPVPRPIPVPKAAPMHRIDRKWLSAWSVLLDVNQGVAGNSTVAALLRAAPVKDPPKTSRFLPAAIAAAVTSIEKPSSFIPGAFTMARSVGGQIGDAGAPRRRTAELLAALSAGLDAAESRAPGHAVRTAIIAAQIGQLLDRSEEMRSSLLYAGLLGDAGTTGRAQEPSKRLIPTLSRRSGSRSSKTPVHLSRPDRAAAVIRALGLSIQVSEAVCSADE